MQEQVVNRPIVYPRLQKFKVAQKESTSLFSISDGSYKRSKTTLLEMPGKNLPIYLTFYVKQSNKIKKDNHSSEITLA